MSGEQYLGLAAGKLTGHPTFSVESPYSIDGFRNAQGGQWSGEDGNWTYRPSQSQIDRDPEYLNKLHMYYSREKGNGIDNIAMPKGLAATYITEAHPSVGLLESNEGLIEYMSKKGISDDTTPSNRIFLPMKENSHKKAVYDRYKDDMYSATEDKALQKGIEAIPLATAGVSPGIKASTVAAGKVIPGIGFAFGAKDAVDGYFTADKTFNSPSTVEKIANASATVGNGLSLGILPIDKAAKGLASLLTGNYYGTLDDITPSNGDVSIINTKGDKSTVSPEVLESLLNKLKQK